MKPWKPTGSASSASSPLCMSALVEADAIGGGAAMCSPSSAQGVGQSLRQGAAADGGTRRCNEGGRRGGEGKKLSQKLRCRPLYSAFAPRYSSPARPSRTKAAERMAKSRLPCDTWLMCMAPSSLQAKTLLWRVATVSRLDRATLCAEPIRPQRVCVLCETKKTGNHCLHRVGKHDGAVGRHVA